MNEIELQDFLMEKFNIAIEKTAEMDFDTISFILIDIIDEFEEFFCDVELDSTDKIIEELTNIIEHQQEEIARYKHIVSN